MQRKITFRTKIEYPPITACVYKIWFGSFYYIGVTKSFKKRMSEHGRALDKEMLSFNPRGTYSKIVLHLKKNDHISEAVIEVVRLCEVEQIFSIEREYHLAALDDKRCLNLFYHHRTRIKAINLLKKQTDGS